MLTFKEYLSKVKDWTGFPTQNGPGDRTLMTFLNGLEEDFIPDFLGRHLSDSTTPGGPRKSPLKSIFSICRSAESSAPLFSLQTASDFHDLVLAAFKGFTTSLMRLSSHYNKLVRPDLQLSGMPSDTFAVISLWPNEPL